MLAGIFLSLSGFGRMEEADYTFPVEYGGGVVVSPTGKKRLMTSDEVLGAPREFLSVSAYEEGTVSVTIANVWERDIQIWSREGSLSGWLEARVGGDWLPIQWLGNSRCATFDGWASLKRGHWWEFLTHVPAGGFETEVRFALDKTGSGTIGRKLSYSLPMKMAIDPGVLFLAREDVWYLRADYLANGNRILR